MKRMKRNSILPILVLTSIMGISSCSTDYMAYDVGLKEYMEQNGIIIRKH